MSANSLSTPIGLDWRFAVGRTEYDREGRAHKAYYRADGRGIARADKPSTLATYRGAKAALEADDAIFDGLGLALGDGLVAVIVHNGIDDRLGVPTGDAMEILRILNTRVEVIGDDVQLFCLADDATPIATERVSIVVSGFVTLGTPLAGKALPIAQRDVELRLVRTKFIERTGPAPLMLRSSRIERSGSNGTGSPIVARTGIHTVLRLADRDVSSDGWFRCPSHGDSRPSAHIVPGGTGWVCFSCGARGGVLDLAVALGLAADRASAARALEMSR